MTAERHCRFLRYPAKLIGPALAYTVLLCSSVPTPALAYCRLKAGELVAGSSCSAGGTPLAWRRRCISYAVFPSATDDPPLGEVLGAIDDAFKSWTNVNCQDRQIEIEIERLKDLSQCSVPQHNPDGPNLNSIAFVSDWLERGNQPEAFALTSVWHDQATGEILDVDMELNEDPELEEILGKFGICPEGAENRRRELPVCAVDGLVDIQNVVTHEAGHFLGLGHSDVSPSVMRYRAETSDLSKRTLKADDVEGICAIYPPGSLPEQCDFTPRNGKTLVCYEPQSADGCGCRAAGGRSGGNWPGMAAALLLAIVLLRPIRRGLRARVKITSHYSAQI